MDKQIQTATQFSRGRMFNRDNTRKTAHQILVLKTGIAGMQHHIENEEENKALNSIEPGTELKLYREPENEHDKWAIAVYLTNDDKIGYISRFKNETIARLMDAGKKFIAIVDDPTVDEEAKEILEKELKRHHRAPTENMGLPFSVYYLEEL